MLLIQCYAQNYNRIIQQALAFIVCNYSGTSPHNCPICTTTLLLLAIIPRAFGLMGYLLRAHVGEGNSCFSRIQLVVQKYRDKTTLASKM